MRTDDFIWRIKVTVTFVTGINRVLFLEMHILVETISCTVSTGLMLSDERLMMCTVCTVIANELFKDDGKAVVPS